MPADFAYTPPNRGEFYEATVLSIDDERAIVHLAATKRDGIVPGRDLESLDRTCREEIHHGDCVPVRVLSSWSREGYVVVSIRQGRQYEDWMRARTLVETGEVVELPVIEVNRGGAVVSFGRLRGFVPNSHLAFPFRPTTEQKEELIGRALNLVAIEADQRRGRYVLSERKANVARREQLLQQLQAGGVYTGIVRNLVDYGAFVDLGGVVGLIHVSELDWSYVEHPNQVLQIGDQVDVLVLSIDLQRERIQLSRKRLLACPWEDVSVVADDSEQPSRGPSSHDMGSETDLQSVVMAETWS